MWTEIGCFVVGLIVGWVAVCGLVNWKRSRSQWLNYDLQRFFKVQDSTQIEVKDRSFAAHSAPDIKLGNREVVSWTGIRVQTRRRTGLQFLSDTDINWNVVGPS